MKEPLRTLGGVLAVALLGWLAYAWLDPSEPRYQGRRLSEWFKQYYRSGQFSRRADDVKRAEATAAFRALGTNAVPFLLDECFAERRDPGFTNLLKALATLPKPFQFPPFVSAAYINEEAAEAIGIVRPPASVLLPRLTNALASANDRRRRMALYLLGYVGEGGETVVPILAAKLRSQAIAERGLAAQSLDRLGKAAKPALPTLIEIAGDTASSRGCIFSVCRALGNLGADATTAIPVLKKRWGAETNWSTRVQLAAAMCRIDERETEVLHSIIEQIKDASHRQSAIRALGDIGRNAKAAAPALGEVMTVADVTIWNQAAWALSRIGETNVALARLLEKAESGDLTAQFNAASMILRIQPTNAIAQSNLLSLAQDSFWGDVALNKLAELGSAAKPMVPALRELTAGTNRFRHQAATALRQIEAASVGTNSATKR